MTEFYTPAVRTDIRSRKNIYALVCAGLLLAACALCVLVCLRVRSYNWRSSFALCLGVFALAGWTDIIINEFALKKWRAEHRHLAALDKGEKSRICCVILSTGAPARVPGGVELCRVRVKTDEGESVYSVNPRFVNLLPRPGERALLALSGSCITGCEAYDENA